MGNTGINLNGNGMFVWLVDRAMGRGTLADMVSLAKRKGLSWVAVKIADGFLPYRGVSNPQRDRRDLTADLADALKSVGVLVWGWHYVYGYLPEREADIADTRMRELGLDGYIIDAEAEYKNREREAKAFIRRLKHDYPLALCSYRFPNYHPEFPFGVFLDAVDVNMPQVYWMGAQNSRWQLSQSIYQYKRFRPLPFVPIGATFSEHGWSPNLDSIRAFVGAVKDFGLPAYGWWEWYDAFVRHPEWGDAATGTGESSSATRYVFTPYTNLRYRSAPSLTAPVLGYLEKGRLYAMTRQENGWGYLPDLNAWVSLAYCTLV